MTLNLDAQSSVELTDGNKIPVIGFGTYEIDADRTVEAVTSALEAGYRHIDSAAWYYNERECGIAIRKFISSHNLPRSSIFYTTKLQTNGSYNSAKAAINKSLKACGLDYIDLYLLHSPLGGEEKRKESWRAVCDAKKEGKIKSIGVSNFGERHIQEMVESGVELPVINQVDLHPFMTRIDIVDICQKHNIALEAWAPLVRGLRFQHPSIKQLAQKYQKDATQVLMRYSLQKGYIPLPKSVNRSRIESNLNVFDFEISQNDMDHLDSLDEELVTDWDPTKCP